MNAGHNEAICREGASGHISWMFNSLTGLSVRGGVCGYCPGVVGRRHSRGYPSPPAQPLALPGHSLLLPSHQSFKYGYLMQKLSYKSTLKHFLTIQAFGTMDAEDHMVGPRLGPNSAAFGAHGGCLFAQMYLEQQPSMCIMLYDASLVQTKWLSEEQQGGE